MLTFQAERVILMGEHLNVIPPLLLSNSNSYREVLHMLTQKLIPLNSMELALRKEQIGEQLYSAAHAVCSVDTVWVSAQK